MKNLKNITKTVLILAGSTFFTCGCGGYDQGYDDAWDETKDGLSYAFSESYKEGYEEGADDAYFFDLGCNDADQGKAPIQPNNSMYMEGYYECGG